MLLPLFLSLYSAERPGAVSLSASLAVPLLTANYIMSVMRS